MVWSAADICRAGFCVQVFELFVWISFSVGSPLLGYAAVSAVLESLCGLCLYMWQASLLFPVLTGIDLSLLQLESGVYVPGLHVAFQLAVLGVGFFPDGLTVLVSFWLFVFSFGVAAVPPSDLVSRCCAPWASGCVLLAGVTAAVSQPPSPESNPNSPSPVTTMDQPGSIPWIQHDPSIPVAENSSGWAETGEEVNLIEYKQLEKAVERVEAPTLASRSASKRTSDRAWSSSARVRSTGARDASPAI
ncbi:hypothetical protein SADUNF_Sadunf18G0044600 [Salix dunnii]|uniref:Uncharacterized protein n=1 Tax=Salix dunnii TaxID=1413687 RepID=A0A835J0J9_9ROSI|nr:hypothetical protein SADUNF_Sadunf18G0044600 [Salix dunnii]